MDDINPILTAIGQPGKKVLATIIRVHGSAYKKEGSCMLFMEDGSQIGMLSPGCLEADLTDRVKKVMDTAETITISYDMRNETDFEWGQGAGCNGKIEILLEPVTQKLGDNLSEVKRLLDDAIPVIGLKKIRNKIEYLFIPEKGKAFGNWRGEHVPVNFQTVKSGTMLNQFIFQQLFLPKPRLIVFGGGADAAPLVKIAKIAGFSVSVCDWREEYCNQRNFPMADSLHIGFPKELISQLTFTAFDCVVIMSHQFQRDQEILEAMLHKEIKYIGVLGPKERTKRLLKGQQIPKWVHSPVGISIGAKGPEEIAISIMAELIQILRNSTGKVTKSLWMIPD